MTGTYKPASGPDVQWSFTENGDDADGDGLPNALDPNSDVRFNSPPLWDLRDRTKWKYKSWVAGFYVTFRVEYLNPGSRDTDGDGIADEDELLWGSDPTDATSKLTSSTVQSDVDGDGLSLIEERILGLDPAGRDKDNDLLWDGEELDPLGIDENHDGNTGDNGDFVTQVRPTLPDNPNSDGDATATDRVELIDGTDPMVRDTDGDGLNDEDESPRAGPIPAHTLGKALNADTDGDSLSDFEEKNGYSLDRPSTVTSTHAVTWIDKEDTDNDDAVGSAHLMSDAAEIYRWASDPNDPAGDADHDAIPDNLEVYSLGTHPDLEDTDLDGLKDGEEDADHNGIIAGAESDPKKTDSDDDYLVDGYEVNKAFSSYVPLTASTNPTQHDTDLDNLWDCAELALAADPNDADTDNDGLKDGDEVPGGGSDHDALQFQNGRTYLSNPVADDSDLDGIKDGVETLGDADDDGGTNAMDVDADNDWIRDGTPGTPGTLDEDYVADVDGDTVPNALDGDSFDNDRMSDPVELFFFDPGLAMNDSDRDDDGLPDGSEYSHFYFNPVAEKLGDGAIPNDAIRVRANPSAAIPIRMV